MNIPSYSSAQGQHSDPCALSALEPFFCDFSAARPRFVARLARSDSPQSRGPCPRADPPSPRPSRSASEVARSRLRGLPHANLSGLPHATQSNPRFVTTTSLSGSEIAHTRWATETQYNSQPETPKGSWPLLLPRRRHRRRCWCCCCCCCAATVLLQLHDPRCIAEHKPSQQTAASRFVFLGTHVEASNGTAAAAAAAAVACLLYTSPSPRN